MNEFVIWDKIFKCFLDTDNIFIDEHGDMYNIEDGDIRELNNSEHSLHKNIEIKDINSKNIYADCSIIEFKHKTLTDKVIGYFTFDDSEYLRYEIKILNINHAIANKSNFVFAKSLFSDIKIIDTIQENKLKLIK